MKDSFSFCITALRKDFLQFSSERLQRAGLSPGLLYFLIYIGKHPGCSSGEVAAALKADTGHTARSLEKLSRGGLVCRSRSETDGRACQLKLTEKGEAAFGEAHRVFEEWDSQALDCLSEEEREESLRILQKLVRHRIGS